jgi:hypothetical protein
MSDIRCQMPEAKSGQVILGYRYRYRARKQAADSSVGRLLTRAVLYRSCVARFTAFSEWVCGASTPEHATGTLCNQE